MILNIIDMNIQAKDLENYGLTIVQRRLTRFFLSMSLMVYGFAIVIEVFEAKKINYLVILDLPPAKVTASYRTIFSIGSIVNIIVCFFITLCFTK